MKVYLVDYVEFEENEYTRYTTRGIFSTETKAQEYIKGHDSEEYNNTYGNGAYFTITEFEVDE